MGSCCISLVYGQDPLKGQTMICLPHLLDTSILFTRLTQRVTEFISMLYCIRSHQMLIFPFSTIPSIVKCRPKVEWCELARWFQSSLPMTAGFRLGWVAREPFSLSTLYHLLLLLQVALDQQFASDQLRLDNTRSKAVMAFELGVFYDIDDTPVGDHKRVGYVAIRGFVFCASVRYIQE